MPQTRRDRAPCSPDDLEDDQGAPAGHHTLRRVVDEVEQLVELDKPRGDAALGEAEVGDGGHPELQVARRERPVGAPDEREGARILLPQKLERRSRVRGGVGGVLGHEPSRIGATSAVAAGTGRRGRSDGRS